MTNYSVHSPVSGIALRSLIREVQRGTTSVPSEIHFRLRAMPEKPYPQHSTEQVL